MSADDIGAKYDDTELVTWERTFEFSIGANDSGAALVDGDITSGDRTLQILDLDEILDRRTATGHLLYSYVDADAMESTANNGNRGALLRHEILTQESPLLEEQDPTNNETQFDDDFDIVHPPLSQVFSVRDSRSESRGVFSGLTIPEPVFHSRDEMQHAVTGLKYDSSAAASNVHVDVNGQLLFGVIEE